MTQQQRHFHLDLQEPHDALRVAEALRQANIETWEVREVSPNHDGVILTQALARGIWQQETGQIRCEGHCRNEPGAPQHMTWEELSTDQQETFTSRPSSLPRSLPRSLHGCWTAGRVSTGEG